MVLATALAGPSCIKCSKSCRGEACVDPLGAVMSRAGSLRRWAAECGGQPTALGHPGLATRPSWRRYVAGEKHAPTPGAGSAPRPGAGNAPRNLRRPGLVAAPGGVAPTALRPPAVPAGTLPPLLHLRWVCGGWSPKPGGVWGVRHSQNLAPIPAQAGDPGGRFAGSLDLPSAAQEAAPAMYDIWCGFPST